MIGPYDCIGCGPFDVCSCGKVERSWKRQRMSKTRSLLSTCAHCRREFALDKWVIHKCGRRWWVFEPFLGVPVSSHDTYEFARQSYVGLVSRWPN